MPDIRAKFFVAEITKYPGSDRAKVVCRAVTRGAVNASFASATPSGELILQVDNPAAVARYDDWMARKREFYLDSTEYTPVVGDGHKFVPSPEGHYNHDRCSECGGARGEHSAAA